MQTTNHHSKVRESKIISPSTHKFLFILIGLFCLMPIISAPLALLLGVIFANTLGNPIAHLSGRMSQLLLQAAVVGLGFGMNVHQALQTGQQGITFGLAAIFCTLVLGGLLAKLLKIEFKISYLISCGTAICGGSAIAAIAPVVNANEKQISVALGVVFMLNALALFIFPIVGHSLSLSQHQFGLWAAIAIHDTSSVIGAASKYGAEALEVATTVKLTRALWIIPISLATAMLSRKNIGQVKLPWFIGLFVLAIMINTYVPFITPISAYLVWLAKASLTLCLFIIGSGLSYHSLKKVGIGPLLQGMILWLTMSALTLWAICKMV
jgi:uncharacterized integral membrane protein (TIGR00698 family)